MLNPVKLVGEAAKFTGKMITAIGLGTLFLMALVGTIAIDIVIWAAIIALFRGRHGENSFATGFLFAMMFSDSGSSGSDFNFKAGIILSPFLTLIAIALSVCLGVPEIGMALIAGWLIGFSLVGAGVMMSVTGNVLISIGELLGELLSTGCQYEHHHDETYTYDYFYRQGLGRNPNTNQDPDTRDDVHFGESVRAHFLPTRPLVPGHEFFPRPFPQPSAPSCVSPAANNDSPPSYDSVFGPAY